ncbi:MAG: YggS family pyridoxal phosphate-dependent enzyme [Candidatus Bipolaricaulota bacterium]
MHPVEESCRKVLEQVPEDVTVLAAVKGRGADEVRAAIGAGIGHLGGNYVQHVEKLRPAVPEAAVWHMIGPLQKNKARKALEAFHWIQTVDSLELGQRLSRLAGPQGPVSVLVQVNIGREPQKAGALPEDVPELVRALGELPGLDVRGLMTLPPLPEHPEDSRPYFRRMRRLLSDLEGEGISGGRLDVLSMGMSADWQVAVEEGATMIRLGTTLFGPR